MPIIIEGFKELNAALQKIGDKAIPAATTAVDAAGEVVLRNVIKHAKGNLKNGLEKKRAVSKSGYITGTVQLKSGFGYGAPLELGHYLVAWGKPTNKYIQPRPFMRPGADESVDEVTRIVMAAVDKILSEFGG